MSIKESFELGSWDAYAAEGWTRSSTNATVSTNWAHNTLMSHASEGSYCLRIDWDCWAQSPALYSGHQYASFAINPYQFNSGTDATYAAQILFQLSGTTQCAVRIGASGTVYAYRGTTLIATSTEMIPVPLAPHWVQVELVAQDSGGTFNVTIDGTSYISFTGDTRNAGADGWDQIRWYGIASTKFYIDDLIVTTSGEGTVTEQYCVVLRPTSDSTVALTRSAGTTNYENVDEVPANTSDYCDATVTLQSDEYGTGPTLLSLGSVFGTSIKGYVTRDGVIVDARVGVKSSASYGYGSYLTLPATGSWTIVRGDIDVDPNTAAAWTDAGLASMLCLIQFQ